MRPAGCNCKALMYWITPLIHGVFGDRQGLAHPLAPTRELVVAHGNPKTSTSWIKSLGLTAHLMTPSGANSHNMAEVEMWMRWIRDHYEVLPDYTVFLDDQGPAAWHKPVGWRQGVLRAEPRDTFSLGVVTGDHNLRNCYFKYPPSASTWSRNCERETWQCAYTLLQWFHKFYNRTVHSETCCTDMVVSRKAILQHSKETYEFVVTSLGNNRQGHPLLCASGKWGYALERMGSIIWSLVD